MNLKDAVRRMKAVKKKLDDQEKRLKALGTCDPVVQSLLDDVRRDKKAVEDELSKLEARF